MNKEKRRKERKEKKKRKNRNETKREKQTNKEILEPKKESNVGPIITYFIHFYSCSVCGIHHSERASGKWSFFDTTWFVVVTFSTVGYGEITPKHWTTQTFVMIMIGIALVMLPIEV